MGDRACVSPHAIKAFLIHNDSRDQQKKRDEESVKCSLIHRKLVKPRMFRNS